MAVVLPTILQPGVVNQAISQIKVTNDRLQNFFGMQGGSDMGGRHFSWDIFNFSREIPSGRAPANGPATISAMPVGNVVGTYPRVHEKLPLLYEMIHNLRQIGGPTTSIDTAGERYIVGQETRIKQRLTNYKEFQIAAMLRGAYYFTQNGDDLTHSFSSGTVTVDYQVPSGNKAQLDMLGAGNIIGATWSNTSTDIPAQIENISAAMEQLNGYQIAHAWCNFSVIQNVLNNAKVQARAGSVNQPYQRYEKIGNNDYEFVLQAIPWLTWHVSNAVLNFDGTATKLFANNTVKFMPDPSPEWVDYWNGSEPVVEWVGRPASVQYGTYYYARQIADPAGYELLTLHNGLPVLFVPSCLCDATVVF